MATPGKEHEQSRKLTVGSQVGALAPLTAVDEQRLRQEQAQLHLFTTTEAIDRLQMLRERNAATESPRERYGAMASLVVHRGAIVEAHAGDALEEARAARGMDKRRDELMTQLVGMVSVEEGLRKLNRLSKGFSPEEFTTVKDANRVFPSLTIFELGVFSLIDHVPETYIAFGNNLDVSGVDEFNELPPNRKDVTPCFVGATPQAVQFSVSDYDFSSEDNQMRGDPYVYLGITGESFGTETVPFTPEVRNIMDELVPLVFSNKRLHEKLLQDARGSGLSIGFGRVAEAAYQACFGEAIPRDPRTLGIDTALGHLSAEQKQAFENMREEMERKIAGALLVDLGQDTPLRDDEIFLLVSILDHVPSAFLKHTEPFKGYIMPYADGVKVIDAVGTLQEFVPYNQYFFRQAVISIFWETVDPRRLNATFRTIFDELRSQVQGKVYTRAIENDEELSLLDDIRVDLLLRFGIDLAIDPQMSLFELRNTEDLLSTRVFSGDGYANETNSKLSLREAEDISRTLSLLPRDLLTNIARIKKMVSSSIPIEAYLTGDFKQGEYTRDKEIVLYPSTDEVPKVIEKQFRVREIFVLLHEIGESVWQTLTKEEQAAWSSISWKDGVAQGNTADHFLTYYAHAVGPRDDFCDHFAAYVFHAGEFRDKTDESDPIKEKYEILKALFVARGRAAEYPQLSPFTLSEIHGALEQEAHKMSLEETIQAQDQAITAELEESAELRRDVIRDANEVFVDRPEEEAQAQEADEYDATISTLAHEDYEVEDEDQRMAAEMIGELTSVLSQYHVEDTARKIARRISPYLNEGDLETVAQILSHDYTPGEIEDIMDEVQEIYEGFSQIDKSSPTGFTDE